MGIRVHELHPQLIHAPLILLPSAAITDVVAALTGQPALERTGRALWWATSLSAALAGTAGLAASQEVKAEEKEAHDKMFLHGLGNATLLLGAVGLATYRTRRPPSLATCLLGLTAVGLAGYTAYLGGELTYKHGIGVKKDLSEAELDRLSPSLASREAPGRLLRDALRGAGWLLGKARRILRGEESVEPAAFDVKAVEQRLSAGPVTPAPTVGAPPLSS